MGKFNVKETKASQGYTLNPKVDTVTLDYVNSQTREIVRTLDVKEDIIRGDIELAKFGKNSINGEATTMQPLANVIFSITSNTTGNTWYIKTNENGYADSISGSVYSRITSNAAGEISVDPSSMFQGTAEDFLSMTPIRFRN